MFKIVMFLFAMKLFSDYFFLQNSNNYKLLKHHTHIRCPSGDALSSSVYLRPGTTFTGTESKRMTQYHHSNILKNNNKKKTPHSGNSPNKSQSG